MNEKSSVGVWDGKVKGMITEEDSGYVMTDGYYCIDNGFSGGIDNGFTGI
jgi:hypothetical protein